MPPTRSANLEPLPVHSMTEPGTEDETPVQYLERDAWPAIRAWGINHPDGRDWGHVK